MGSGTDRIVERALARLSPNVREAFARDPLGTVQTHLGLSVAEVPELADRRSSGGRCDGVSFLEHGVLLFARTRSKRYNFTIAHEVGHWLVDQTAGIYDWIGDQPDPQAILENLCDRIAQRLLLPDTVIDQVVGEGPLRASHLLRLASVSNASRAASCIGIVRRLPGAGAVAYASRETGAIAYSSIQPHPELGWPTVYPWPGQSLPEGSPFLQLGTGQESTKLSAWTSRWGKTVDYFIDAVADEDYIYLIFSDMNIWQITTGFVPKELQFDRRPHQTIFCCGQERAVRGYPCASCGQISCPKCGRCRCDKRSSHETPCSDCGTVYLPHLLDTDGRCEMCA